MAKIGMEYVVSALLSEESGSAVYSAGKYWGPSSSFNLTTNNNDVTDYGDNKAVETDKTLSTISVSVELNELTLALEAELLGHEYNAESKEMKTTVYDIAPNVGLGCIGLSRRDNKDVYRAIFLNKVQFANPADENTTKQESTAFNHTTFEGTAFPLNTGEMSVKAEFDTLAAAKTWLNAKVGISE